LWCAALDTPTLSALGQTPEKWELGQISLETIFLQIQLSYSVKEVLSEDAVSDSVSWSDQTRARSEKTY